MNSYKTNTNGQYLNSSSHSGLFSVIIMVLIFINLSYLFFNNGNQMSFSSFLNGLSDIPSVNVDVVRNFSQQRITDDWTFWLSKELEIGISFNWLRNFINSFIMPLLSMVAFFLAGLTQLIVFIGWVIGFIFDFLFLLFS